jgi:hypothetical protein
MIFPVRDYLAITTSYHSLEAKQTNVELKTLFQTAHNGKVFVRLKYSKLFHYENSSSKSSMKTAKEGLNYYNLVLYLFNCSHLEYIGLAGKSHGEDGKALEHPSRAPEVHCSQPARGGYS